MPEMVWGVLVLISYCFSTIQKEWLVEMTNIFGMALKPPARKFMSGSALEFMSHASFMARVAHFGITCHNMFIPVVVT